MHDNKTGHSQFATVIVSARELKKNSIKYPSTNMHQACLWSEVTQRPFLANAAVQCDDNNAREKNRMGMIV